MLDFIDKWKNKRGNSKRRNIIVMSKKLFPIVCDKLKGCNNIAYISIEATDDCALYYLFEDNFHYLKDADNVLNLEFDDLEQDREYKGHLFKTISMEQAGIILDFVENHLDCDIIVHCKAGKSRSQGVFRAIMDMYSDYFEECSANKENPCLTPNMEVVRKIKRCFYERNGMFGIEKFDI